MWPSDWLTGIFLFLFVFGLVCSVASFVFSVGDDLPGIDLDGGDSHHDHGSPSPFSISTIMVFLTWFGAAGYIARTWGGLAAWLTLPLAIVVGLIGGTLIWLFLAKVLRRGQQGILDPEQYDLHGVLATVTSAIRAGGTGEIIYSIDKRRRTDGARSVDGSAIPVGAEVTIIRFTGGLAYVAPLEWADRDAPFTTTPVEELSIPPPR